MIPAPSLLSTNYGIASLLAIFCVLGVLADLAVSWYLADKPVKAAGLGLVVCAGLALTVMVFSTF
jgi:hypothetical protein